MTSLPEQNNHLQWSLLILNALPNGPNSLRSAARALDFIACPIQVYRNVGSLVRAIDRDVFLSDLQDPATVLGGLVLAAGVTNDNLYTMVEIVFILQGTYFIQNDDGDTLPRDTRPLLPGLYLIVTDSPIQANDEIVLTRGHSINTASRTLSFRDEVRERDGRCVISKVANRRKHLGYWYGFDAAHIFPLAYADQWIANNFDHGISLPPRTGSDSNINFV